MRRLLIVLSAASLLASAVPAWAGPIPGGSVNSTPQADKAADVLSPAVPGPEWIVPIDGHRVGARAMLLDDAGHLLVPSVRDEDLAPTLTAINVADGSAAWGTEGVSGECTPVTSDDGRVYVVAVEDGPLVGGDGPVALQALDSAEGLPIDGVSHVPTDTDPELMECRHGLQLTPDDVLLVGYKRGTINDPYVLHAFDASGDSIDPLWRIERTARNPENAFYSTALSNDGASVWIGHRDDDDNLMVERIAVADGSSQGVIVVEGQEFGTGGDGSNNPYTVAAVDDGLIVETDAADGSDRLIRVDPDPDAPDSGLVQTWQVELDADPIQGEVSSFAIRDDRLYGIAGARQVIALDTNTGEVVYARDLGTNIRGGEPIAVDAIGNVVVAPLSRNSLVSLTPDGQIRWETGPPEDFFGTIVPGRLDLIGPIGPDGTLYVAAQGGDSPPQPVIAAINNGTFRLNEEGDVIDAAIQLCQYLFADGEARSVILSRDDEFPDVLAGAPLAGDHSCILYTPGGPDQALDPRTLAEIVRVLEPGGPVRIVGGPAAVSTAASDELTDEGFAVERIGGANRFETALLIARIVAEENDSGQEVLLAFGANWPDAVTGGAWAAKTGTPVLLTGSAELAEEAATGLAEFGTTLTTIAGGTAVVSQAVEDAVPGETRRVSGPNRFATAVDVATTLWAEDAADQAFVLANLEVEFGWALALAASPLSVRLCAPQVGIANGRYPAESSAYLASLDLEVPPGVFVLGDLNVIDDGVVQEVETDLGR